MRVLSFAKAGQHSATSIKNLHAPHAISITVLFFCACHGTLSHSMINSNKEKRMSFRLKSVVLVTALSLSAGSAVAANSIQGVRFGDWGGNCQTAQNGKSVCYLEQTVSKEGNDQPLMVTVIGYAPNKKNPTVILELPAGVDMKQGIHLQVDLNSPVSFVGDCQPKGCRAGFALDDKMTGQFKKGKKAVVAFTPAAGSKPMLLPISLKGLSSGLQVLR
jgi:invasion protein IalB